MHVGPELLFFFYQMLSKCHILNEVKQTAETPPDEAAVGRHVEWNKTSSVTVPLLWCLC